MNLAPSHDRPNLLFLTPILPYTTGTGSAIRAGITVASLARHFNVYVLHADLWGWHENSFKTDFVRQHAARYVYFVPQGGEIPMPQIMAEYFRDIRFQAIHTFRLIMARAAVSALLQSSGPKPFGVLDMDDDECERDQRFLQLGDETGENLRSRQDEAPRAQNIEHVLVTRFDAVCLAAQEDCERVSRRYPRARLVHLPNAVFPSTAALSPSPGHVPTLLFVGTLSYLPNEDGVNYFCAHVLPLLRQSCPHPIRVRLVGAKPGERVTSLSRHPEVEVLADVPDLAQYYADANVVIVPLRAGSGTRIKILEAFSFRKPVVSTTAGAAGLPLAHGKELLIADEPAAFAAACASLLQDGTLARRITNSAWDWLEVQHSMDCVDAALESLYEPVLKGRHLPPIKSAIQV
jgi:glycosyltransferase involved in cell wall biosynthesis